MANEPTLLMTEPELVQLIGMTPGEPARRSADAFGLGDALDNADLRRAGIQTLFVRGLAVLSDGDRLDAVHHGQVVGAVLGNATDWYVLNVDGPNVKSWITVVGSPHGNLAFLRGAIGVHEVVPLDADRPLLSAVRSLLGAFVSDTALTRPLTARVRRITPQGDRGVRIDVDEQGTWRAPLSSILVATGTPDEVWARAEQALGA